RGRYGVSGQKVTSTLTGRRAKTVTYQVRVTNRGNTAERLAIRGTRGSKQLTVVYLLGRKNVTSSVLRGSLRTGTVQAGRSVTLTVRVTKAARAAKGSSRTFTVRATSPHDRTKTDAVTAVVRTGRR
ncbi:MAG: hypothetical protein ABWY50_04845, partial [Aeromicrobium sp.]